MALMSTYKEHGTATDLRIKNFNSDRLFFLNPYGLNHSNCTILWIFIFPYPFKINNKY